MAETTSSSDAESAVIVVRDSVFAGDRQNGRVSGHCGMMPVTDF